MRQSFIANSMLSIITFEQSRYFRKKTRKKGGAPAHFLSRLLSEITGLLKRYDGEHGVRNERLPHVLCRWEVGESGDEPGFSGYQSGHRGVDRNDFAGKW